ncbi:uncharacterized protein LOC133860497 [Alnus glutinosa]|uniref:uncharacterized protein LOC133860497 n=1 Tax=Alnus glutinosa TaxID=3517 RepID=UPI002D795FD4|nr:uncharacterized protein LOC133860497 [Alnus glutinosa]
MNDISNSKTYKRRRSASDHERMAGEEDYDVVLCLAILSAEGLDSPSSHPSVGKRIYRVVYWVEPEYKFCTLEALGLLNPVWEEQRRIVLGVPGKYREFLNLEVVRVCSKADPGTSSGVVVVGRAQIPLPWKLYKNKSGRFGLVRVEGLGLKAEGHIALSMELKKIRRNEIN